MREVPSRFMPAADGGQRGEQQCHHAGAPMMINVPNSYGLPTQLLPPRLSEAARLR